MEGALTLARWEKGWDTTHTWLDRPLEGNVEKALLLLHIRIKRRVGYAILGQEVPFEGLLRLLRWKSV